MWELVKSGGWLMLPILLCSIAALVIIIERWVRLQMPNLFPANLRQQLVNQLFDDSVSRSQLQRIKKESPLGDVLATGLLYREYGLDSMTMHMQNRASVQIHALEKNINMLGTIGAISPLLGLLGTVLGIIMSFLAITEGAMKDPTLLAAGVSQALITTAAGMFVAIPALIAYRFYQRRIVDINAQLEQEAGLLIQELYDHELMVEYQPVKSVVQPQAEPVATQTAQQTTAQSPATQQAAQSQSVKPVQPTFEEQLSQVQPRQRTQPQAQQQAQQPVQSAALPTKTVLEPQSKPTPVAKQPAKQVEVDDFPTLGN